MAADLKSVLRSVVSSRGAKKFYFAYAAGKRTDGKGDGELVVRGAKPKKTEIEAAIVGCREVLEGVCWSGKGPDDVGTVYFKGSSKSLSQMGVAKMAITAKKLTGSQYDFQIPSTAKEAPEQDAEEDDEEEKPDKAALAKAKALKERFKALSGRAKVLFVRAPSAKAKVSSLMNAASTKVERDATDEDAETAVDKFEEALDKAEQEAASAGDGNGNGNGASAMEREAAAAYKARVDALMPELKKAVAKDNAPAKEAKLRFSESQMFGRKKEFPKAMQLLDVAEKQMKKALAAPDPEDEAGGSGRDDDVDAQENEGTQGNGRNQGNGDDEAPAGRSRRGATTDDDAPPTRGRSGATTEAPAGAAADAAKKLAAAGKAFQARLDAMMPKLKKAVATGTPAGNEAKLRYSEAQVFARKKDFPQAMGVLDVIEERVNAALAAAAAPSPQAKAFATRSKAVVEDVKRAIASGHPAGNEAKLKYSEAQVFARKGDFAQARRLMDEVESLAATALSAPATPTETRNPAAAEAEPDAPDGQDDDSIPPAPPAPSNDAEGEIPEAPPLEEPAAPQAQVEREPGAASPQEKAYRIRLKAVGEDVKRAVATGTPQGKEAKLRYSEAQVFGRKNDFDKARELLDKVEELVAEALAAPAPSTDEAAEQNPADPSQTTETDDQDEVEDEPQDVAGQDEDEIPAAPPAPSTDEDEIPEAPPLDDGDETDAQAEVEPEDAPATPAEKAYRTRAKAVAEDVKRAVATGSPAGKEAKLRFSEAQVAGRKGDFQAARALLDEVEELCATAMIPAAPDLEDDAQAAEVQVDEPAAAASPDQKAFATRAKAVAEDVKRAFATGTQAGKDAKLRYSEAQVAGRKGDFAAARALLDEVEELNAQAMVPAAPDLDDGAETAQQAEVEAEDAPATPEEKAYRTRSKAVGEDVKRAVATGTQAGKDAKLRFSEAQVAGRKGDLQAARALLDEVEELCATAMIPAAPDLGDDEGPEAAAEAEPAADASPEEKAYATRSQVVGEDVKRAVATGTPAGQEAKLRYSEAQTAGRKKDFEAAKTLLDEVEELAAKALAAQVQAEAQAAAQAAPAPGGQQEPQAEAVQESARQKRGKEVAAKVKDLGGHPAQGGIEMMLEVALGNPALSDEDFERELAEVESMVKSIADQAAQAQDSDPAPSPSEEAPAPSPQGEAPAPAPGGGQAEAAQENARQKRGKEVSAKVKALGGHPAQGGIEMMLEVALGNPALTDEEFDRELAEVESMVKAIADQAAQNPVPGPEGEAPAPST